MEQPVSKGTQEDVERIVRRDFRPSKVDAAFALLNSYETTPFKERPARVRLAALKCAEGDLAKLKCELQEALVDGDGRRQERLDVITSTVRPCFDG